jgi:hypothetical protein
MVERKGDTPYENVVEEEDVDLRSDGRDKQPRVSETHQPEQFDPDAEADQPRTGVPPSQKTQGRRSK